MLTSTVRQSWTWAAPGWSSAAAWWTAAWWWLSSSSPASSSQSFHSFCSWTTNGVMYFSKITRSVLLILNFVLREQLKNHEAQVTQSNFSRYKVSLLFEYMYTETQVLFENVNRRREMFVWFWYFYPSLTFCLTNWLSYYISDIDDGLLFYWYSLTRPQIPKQRRKRSCYWFSKSSWGPSYSVRQTSQRLFSECVIIISNEAELSSRQRDRGDIKHSGAVALLAVIDSDNSPWL